MKRRSFIKVGCASSAEAQSGMMFQVMNFSAKLYEREQKETNQAVRAIRAVRTNDLLKSKYEEFERSLR